MDEVSRIQEKYEYIETRLGTSRITALNDITMMIKHIHALYQLQDKEIEDLAEALEEMEFYQNEYQKAIEKYRLLMDEYSIEEAVADGDEEDLDYQLEI